MTTDKRQYQLRLIDSDGTYLKNALYTSVFNGGEMPYLGLEIELPNGTWYVSKIEESDTPTPPLISASGFAGALVCHRDPPRSG
jgi:hypothetical protein